MWVSLCIFHRYISINAKLKLAIKGRFQFLSVPISGKHFFQKLCLGFNKSKSVI